MNINEDFQVHDTLNPKLWDSNNKLLPEVKEKILEIAEAFEDYIQVPIKIVDIQLVGSNASYNYTNSSDLDVHLIVDLEAVSYDTNILQKLYDAKKSKFNKNIDISIHGVEVEIYIQDINSTIVSNGIYSVCDDAWVKEPKPITSVKNYDVTDEVNKWVEKIEQAINSDDIDLVVNTRNAIHLMRKNSLSADGEYGKGNQIFKELRNKGLLQRLKDRRDELLSRELTLESLSKGQIVNRY